MGNIRTIYFLINTKTNMCLYNEFRYTAITIMNIIDRDITTNNENNFKFYVCDLLVKKFLEMIMCMMYKSCYHPSNTV